MSNESVDVWLARQSPDVAAGIGRLRAIVRAAAPDADETIKWNAPSFAVGGQDRVTLGAGPKGGLRLVLHRGATKGAAAAPAFDDPDTLAHWPSPDRGVILFASADDVSRKAGALEALVRRWCAT